jgi:predicted Zn-dependent protease
MDLAARVLDLVAAVAPGSQAEVHVQARSRALTRFARSFVHQNVVDTAEQVRLRVVVGGSWATAETDRADGDSLRRTVEAAVAAARLRRPDPAFPGLADGTVPAGGNWDDATADATADQRADVVREFVDAAGGLETAGYVQTERTEAVYANSLGGTAAGRVTAAAADGIALQPLSAYAVSAAPPPGLLLGYGAIQTDRIGPGLRRLRDCLDRL